MLSIFNSNRSLLLKKDPFQQYPFHIFHLFTKKHGIFLATLPCHSRKESIHCLESLLLLFHPHWENKLLREKGRHLVFLLFTNLLNAFYYNHNNSYYFQCFCCVFFRVVICPFFTMTRNVDCGRERWVGVVCWRV